MVKLVDLLKVCGFLSEAEAVKEAVHQAKARLLTPVPNLDLGGATAGGTLYANSTMYALGPILFDYPTENLETGDEIKIYHFDFITFHWYNEESDTYFHPRNMDPASFEYDWVDSTLGDGLWPGVDQFYEMADMEMWDDIEFSNEQSWQDASGTAQEEPRRFMHFHLNPRPAQQPYGFEVLRGRVWNHTTNEGTSGYFPWAAIEWRVPYTGPIPEPEVVPTVALEEEECDPLWLILVLLAMVVLAVLLGFRMLKLRQLRSKRATTLEQYDHVEQRALEDGVVPVLKEQRALAAASAPVPPPVAPLVAKRGMLALAGKSTTPKAATRKQMALEGMEGSTNPRASRKQMALEGATNPRASRKQMALEGATNPRASRKQMALEGATNPRASRKQMALEGATNPRASRKQMALEGATNPRASRKQMALTGVEGSSRSTTPKRAQKALAGVENSNNSNFQSKSRKSNNSSKSRVSSKSRISGSIRRRKSRGIRRSRRSSEGSD